VEGHRSNLLFEGRFEPSLDRGFRSQVYTDYGFQLSSAVKRNGAKSARFEMRSSSDRIRSEILKDEESEKNRWFGNSLYLPSENWASDLLPEGWEIITQWHALDDPGEPARFPPLALVVSKGRLSFQIYWSSKEINTNSNYAGKKIFDLGPVEKDKWLDMVYHINFSHNSDGVLEVWKNGVKVVDFNGPNCYNDDSLPYMKMGIYKRGWNKITKRVIYIDEVRVGNGNATYKDVVPSGANPETNPDTNPEPETEPEQPSTADPLSLVLMNANTDLPIQTLTASSTLDLATLPTYNLNVQGLVVAIGSQFVQVLLALS